MTGRPWRSTEPAGDRHVVGDQAERQLAIGRLRHLDPVGPEAVGRGQDGELHPGPGLVDRADLGGGQDDPERAIGTGLRPQRRLAPAVALGGDGVEAGAGRRPAIRPEHPAAQGDALRLAGLRGGRPARGLATHRRRPRAIITEARRDQPGRQAGQGGDRRPRPRRCPSAGRSAWSAPRAGPGRSSWSRRRPPRPRPGRDCRAARAVACSNAAGTDAAVPTEEPAPAVSPAVASVSPRRDSRSRSRRPRPAEPAPRRRLAPLQLVGGLLVRHVLEEAEDHRPCDSARAAGRSPGGSPRRYRRGPRAIRPARRPARPRAVPGRGGGRRRPEAGARSARRRDAASRRSEPSTQIDRALRASSRKAAWKASSASLGSPSTRRHTPITIGPWRCTRASKAASSRAATYRSSSRASESPASVPSPNSRSICRRAASRRMLAMTSFPPDSR